MEHTRRSRTQSVISIPVRSSGFQLRASKFFSKLKFHSKSSSTNVSPYLDMPTHPNSARNRDSLKPYMSQPVLGLSLSDTTRGEEEIPTPIIHHDPSIAIEQADVPPSSQEGPSPPDDTQAVQSEIPPSTTRSNSLPSSMADPIGNLITQEAHKAPNEVFTASQDGLPTTTSVTSPTDTLSGLPTVSESETLTSFVTGNEPLSMASSLRDLSSNRPPVPTRPPPTPPPSATTPIGAPSIVVSRTPSYDPRNSRLNTRDSMYSVISEQTATDGYATAPSSPSWSVVSAPREPPHEAPTPVSSHFLPSALPEVDTVLYEEPLELGGLTGPDEATPATPLETNSATTTTPTLPALTIRTLSNPGIPSHPPPRILSRTLTSPASPDSSHKRFSTAPGRRGSLVFTPSGELARFSPSIITYHRMPPGSMKLPFPSPSSTVDEYGRITTPSSATSPSSTWNGFLRGASEGGSASYLQAISVGRASSGRVRKATLRDMPAMSVGGEMDNGDDGDHDSTDDYDDGSDDETPQLADAEDTDDDRETGESSASASSPQHGAPDTPREPSRKRLFSFSSKKGKGKESASPDTEASQTPTIPNRIPQTRGSLHGIDGSRSDIGLVQDSDGEGASRHDTPIPPSRQPTIKASVSSGSDYISMGTVAPSSSNSKPSSLHSTTSNQTAPGKPKPFDSPIPPIPPIPKMPQGIEGRHSMYKLMSQSMVNITPHPQANLSTLASSKEKVAVEGSSTAGHADTALNDEMNQGIGPSVSRRRSMPTFNPSKDPPPYPTFPPSASKETTVLAMPAREDEGKEELPAYSNDILLKAIMPMKMEFSAPGVQAKNRKWRRVTCVLEGTVFKIYHCKAGKSVPGGVSALGSWWERKVGAADVSMTVASSISSRARSEKDKERERQRQLEAVRKAQAESGPFPHAGQTEITLPNRSSQDVAASASSSASKLGVGLKPHSRSRSEVSGPFTRPSSSRTRMSLDVSTGEASRSSLSLSTQGQQSSTSFTPSSPSIAGGMMSSSSSIHSSQSQAFTSTITDVIPDPDPSDLIRAYTLQNAESGLGNDYTKRQNVIRVRMEGEQFLLQATDVTEVVDWIEAFHAASDVALDLDERPMPKGPLFPRRRRRRRRVAEAGGVATTSVEYGNDH